MTSEGPVPVPRLPHLCSSIYFWTNLESSCCAMPFPSTEASCEGSEFHLAALSGDEEKVKELISASTNVNTPVVDTWNPGANRRTPLHYAAAGGHAEIVKLLIAAGASVNAKDEPGEFRRGFRVLWWGWGWGQG